MKKENLQLLAQGHKLIAEAYAREAGVELDATVTEEATTPVKETKPTGKVRPKDTAPAKEEPTPEVDEDEEEGYSLDELNGMTVKQLKEIATELEITIPKDTKKADIIDLIMDGAEEADEDAPEEDEEAEATDSDDEEGEELSIEDVENMTLKALKDLAKEYEVDLPKGAKKEEAVEEIVNALFEQDEIDAYYGEDDENTEEETDEDEGDELSPEDLDEMSLSELKALAKEYEVEHPKVIKADKLRELLVAELFADEDDSEDDTTELDADDLAEEYGLNEMSVEDLQELLTDHKIKAKGNKQALIAKVLDAIEEGIIEVGDEEEGE